MLWGISYKPNTSINNIEAHRVSHRFNDIRLSMYVGQAGDFPRLKRRAGEIKHLTGALRSVFMKYMDPGNTQHKQVKMLLAMASEMDLIVDSHPHDFKFPPGVAANSLKCCQGFVQINTALDHHYHPAGILLFHHTIKYHYLLHIGMVAHYISPRLAWCFSGEDMMAKVKRILAASHRGAPPHKAANKVMQKYAQGLGMSLLSDLWKK